MDFYDLQDKLDEYLRHECSEASIDLHYTYITQLLRHDRNELMVAASLVDAGYCLMISAGGVRGVEAYNKILKSHLGKMDRVKKNLAIREKTRQIEEANQD